jgi:predicted nuclease with TOPRIM domain
MASLFELSAEYQKAAQILDDLECDSQTIADTLESIDGPLKEKAENVAKYFQNLEVNAKALKEAEERLASRRKAMENRVEHLKEYLKTNMEKCSILSIECEYFKLSIQNNPESVDVFEPGLVPSEYMVQPEPPPERVDKNLVKKALKDSFDVPGCRLTRSTRLTVK